MPMGPETPCIGTDCEYLTAAETYATHATCADALNATLADEPPYLGLGCYALPTSCLDSLTSLYITGLYWSFTTMTTVGYGDVSPALKHSSEVAVAGAMMLLGTTVFAYVIGAIITLVTKKIAGAVLSALMREAQKADAEGSVYMRQLEARPGVYADLRQLFATYFELYGDAGDDVAT